MNDLGIVSINRDFGPYGAIVTAEAVDGRRYRMELGPHATEADVMQQIRDARQRDLDNGVGRNRPQNPFFRDRFPHIVVAPVTPAPRGFADHVEIEETIRAMFNDE